MDLRLLSITLNTARLEPMKHFYSALGCHFASQQVDKGGMILQGQLGEMVFHLYSLDRATLPVSFPSLQLSLKVKNLDAVMEKLKAESSSQVIMDIEELPEGRRSVVLDPDGNSIDLIEES